MKKLFYICLPLFVCIAVFFALQNRRFDFINMLEIFSTWSFADSLDAFVEMRDTFNYVGEIWDSFSDVSGFWDTISKIGDLIVNLVKGLGQLLLSVAYLILDFVDNILQIVDYLFNYEYVPRV